MENENILDKQVLLSLSIHKFGISKKVNTSQITTDATPEMVRVSKHIIDSKAYDAISKHDGNFTRLLTSLALPSMFRSGVYAVPLALLDRVDSELGKYQETRSSLIDAFIGTYETEVAGAAELLGSLYDPDNYPTPEKVRAAFTIDYKYVSTAVPEKLARIRSDIFERETQKAQQEIQSMTENIKSVLREAVRDMLAHAADKLAPKQDGTSQIFRDSLVGNIREFLETFQARNIADDTDLAEICTQIDGLLLGVTPELLRKDDLTREEIRQNFEKITETLDTMLIDRPRRKIRTVETATETAA